MSRDPNKGGELAAAERVWTPYTVNSKSYIVIDTHTPIIKHGLRNRKCLFWGQQLPKLRAAIHSKFNGGIIWFPKWEEGMWFIKSWMMLSKNTWHTGQVKKIIGIIFSEIQLLWWGGWFWRGGADLVKNQMGYSLAISQREHLFTGPNSEKNSIIQYT